MTMDNGPFSLIVYLVYLLKLQSGKLEVMGLATDLLIALHDVFQLSSGNMLHHCISIIVLLLSSHFQFSAWMIPFKYQASSSCTTSCPWVAQIPMGQKGGKQSHGIITFA